MPITGRSDINAGTLQVDTPDWKVGTLDYNGDPYRMMPEMIYRAYHQQRALSPEKAYGGMQSQMSQKAQMSGWEGGTSREQGAAIAAQSQQTPMFVKMVGMGPNSVPGYVPAQAWEPGAVAAGYAPAGTQPLQTPQSASIQPDYASIYGARNQQQRPQQQEQRQEQTGDESMAAYQKRIAEALRQYGGK